MVKRKKVQDLGKARAPGPSLRDHLLADGSGVTPPLLEESYVFLGDEDIPYECYTSHERLQDEYKNQPMDAVSAILFDLLCFQKNPGRQK